MFKQPEPLADKRSPASAPNADAPSQPPNHRQTILLLGMHRAGTSVLAHLIHLMGAHIGDNDELIPAHPTYNPTGFFERTDLINTHERFLQRQGCEWNRIGRFDLGAVEPAARDALRTELAAMCGRIDSQGHPLLVKDPRLCLLLPVWHEMIQGPFHVFAVRDPRKIADSLLRSFPGVFTTHFLLAMWQKYMTTALCALRGKPVLFLAYEQLLEAPEFAAARLLRGLRALGVRGLRDVAQAQVRALLDRNLNRSSLPHHATLSHAQIELQRWMLQQCEADEAVQVDHLPEFDVPDASLLELERVREEYARRGYLMGAQRASARVVG
jgi:hypothetical protein